MASGRPKRQVTVPKKFSIEEGYTLPDSPQRTEQRRVLRYVNAEDLKRTLDDLAVYVLWPEDGLWYEAIIQRPTEEGQSAKLFYTDTSEEELVDLEELVAEKQIAFLETRSGHAPLKPDEVLADHIIHEAAEKAHSEASDIGGGSSGIEACSPSQEPFHAMQTHSETRIHRRPSLHEGSQSLMPAMGNEVGGYGYEGLNLQGAASDMASAEGSGMESSGSGMNGNPNKKLKRSTSLVRQSSTGSREYHPPVRLDIITKLREKTIEQLKAVLGATPDASLPEAATEETPDDPIAALAKSIEVEIMKLCGGENQEYKNKFRTLYFNLKDVRNPELRRRVLSGEITPDQLVSLSPRELASQELIQWRQKKKEELLQATVLDQEAAAQFSTAAALKQLEVKREQRRSEGDDVTSPAPREDLPQLPVVKEEAPFPEAEPKLEVFEEASPERDETEAPLVIDSVPHETPVSNAPPTEEEPAVDIEEIPDWAMEVVEAPPPVQTAPQLYSPKAAEDRNNSAFGPVPMRQPPADLTPLLMKDDGSLVVGETVWQGVIGFAEQTPFRAQCISIAGKCDLKSVLTSPQIVVQGRMNLKKVEEFLEKLRTSKSRSVTIAILRPPTDATEADIEAIQENVHYYLSRERTGAMALGEGVEGYLIAKCGLTGRLLSTAQMLMQEHERIPNDIDVSEFLLVVVHRKDWTPPRSLETAIPEPPPPPEVMVSDPRIRAGLKPVVQERRDVPEPIQSLPMGLTLESISNLAAMLGVQKPQPVPSSPPPVAPALPMPHQMTVPAGVPATSLPGIEPQPPQLPQSAVLYQPERPKFLIFDPLTNDAIPLDPATVQYDLASNRVLILGPVPQGFVVQPIATPAIEAPAIPDVLTHPQGVPLVMTEEIADVAQMESPSFIPDPSSGVSQQTAQPLMQSRHGRGSFRRVRGRMV